MLRLEHSEILLTCIKLPFVTKIIVLSIFEWPFYTGFTVNTVFSDGYHLYISIFPYLYPPGPKSTTPP